MTQQIINIGTAPNDNTGDQLRSSFDKCNLNFTELYAGVTGVIPQCGRLAYVSATALSFKPYNGDRIRIAGTVYAIPSGGIAGLTNGGLSANTNYYVYAFNSSGTITAEFSTTTHATSTTAGNVGTEIKSGDNTRTVIGMVRTNASSQFQDDSTFRGIINWFNRRNLTLSGGGTSGVATSSGTYVELSSACRVSFCMWGEELPFVAVMGGFVIGTPGTCDGNLGLDGTTNIVQNVGNLTVGTGGWWGLVASAAPVISATEGFHFITPIGKTSGVSSQFYMYANGMLRG